MYQEHPPPESGGYPPPHGSYPPQGNYPPPGTHPQPPAGYPPPSYGYPNSQGGYGMQGGYVNPPPIPQQGMGPPPGGYAPPPGGYGPPPGDFGPHLGGYNLPPGNYGPPPGGPIFNPPTPFEADIQGGVMPGRKILIQGVATGEIFSFNIQDPNGDIGFHFNPRLGHGCIVRNSLLGGSWGSEEQHGPMPFQHGCPFEVMIEIFPNMYRVYVNKQVHSDFMARATPIERFYKLRIEGSVSIQQILFN